MSEDTTGNALDNVAAVSQSSDDNLRMGPIPEPLVVEAELEHLPRTTRGRRRESLVLLHTHQQASDLANQAMTTANTLNDLEALLASLKTSTALAPPLSTPRARIEDSTSDDDSGGEDVGDNRTSPQTQAESTEKRPKKDRRKSRYMEVRPCSSGAAAWGCAQAWSLRGGCMGIRTWK